jgi:hypothetical protein
VQIKIENRLIIPELLSLSGVEIIGKDIFVTGDNLPNLYKINEKGKILKSFTLIPKTEFEGGLMPKHLKPDFEGMCKVKFESGYFLLIFGSGSKSPQRDVLFVVNPEDKMDVKKHSLFDFYSHLRIQGNISSADLNIEAALYYEGKILLFNRGNNFIIEFTLEDLFQHLENKNSFTTGGSNYNPVFKFYQIFLPVLKNIPAGFSGADIFEDRIIFTASVENTFNWVDDGEVLGSYLGFISLKNLKDKYTPPCKLIEENGEILKLKIESVAIKKVSPNGTELILVSDSDGGNSEIIFCRV